MPSGRSGSDVRLSPRAIGGLAIAVLLLVWVVINREDVEVSFGFATVTMSLWLVLMIAGLLGAVVGFLLGRRRYQS